MKIFNYRNVINVTCMEDGVARFEGGVGLRPKFGTRFGYMCVRN